MIHDVLKNPRSQEHPLSFLGGHIGDIEEMGVLHGKL
jgi:hypothetical protein